MVNHWVDISWTVSREGFIIYTIIAPSVYMNVYSYEVTDTQIDVQRGLFIWYHTKIPLCESAARWNVDRAVFRKFDLASVKIITAAGSVDHDERVTAARPIEVVPDVHRHDGVALIADQQIPRVGLLELLAVTQQDPLHREVEGDGNRAAPMCRPIRVRNHR